MLTQFTLKLMETFKKNREDLLIINKKIKRTIAINQIIMMKGMLNYTCFYLQNGKQRVSARTLKHYETLLLGKGFIRVHRSCLVNENCILEHNSITSQLKLTDGHHVAISRRRKGLLNV